VLGALLAGLGFGLIVAAQVGPIWLLCARTALRGQRAAAWGIGAGAALVDATYAALGVAGAAPLLQVRGLRVALGLLGAAVLVVLGGRTLRSAALVRAGSESSAHVLSMAQGLRTSLAATASNPSTIVSWAAIFSAASTGRLVTDAVSTAALLGGVLLGSLAWFTALSLGLGLVSRRLPEAALRLADVAAGLGLVGFGAALGWRTVHDG
jgi:threonine/homoserine/homoserine lactone efflux protein